MKKRLPLILIGLFVLCSVGALAISTDDIQLYYQFENSSYSDSSPNAYDLTTNTATVTFQEGRVGNSADFDGDSAKAQLESVGATFNDQSRIIEYWVNLDSTGTQSILRYSTADNSALHHYVSAGNFGLYTGDGTNIQTCFSFTADVWTYIVVHYNSSGLSVHKDGNPIPECTDDATSPGSTSTYDDINVGVYQSSQWMNGEVDNMIVWNATADDTDFATFLSEGYNDGYGRNPYTGLPIFQNAAVNQSGAEEGQPTQFSIEVSGAPLSIDGFRFGFYNESLASWENRTDFGILNPVASTSNIILYYEMENSSWLDSSPTGADLTPTGSFLYNDGLIQNAAVFDDASTKATTSVNGTFIDSIRTIEVWTNKNSSGDNDVVFRFDTGDSGAAGLTYSNGAGQWRANSGDGSLVNCGSLVLGQWEQWVLHWNSSGFYVHRNGDPTPVCTDDATSPSSTWGEILFGEYTGSSRFNGAIDNFIAWDNSYDSGAGFTAFLEESYNDGLGRNPYDTFVGSYDCNSAVNNCTLTYDLALPGYSTYFNYTWWASNDQYQYNQSDEYYLSYNTAPTITDYNSSSPHNDTNIAIPGDTITFWAAGTDPESDTVTLEVQWSNGTQICQDAVGSAFDPSTPTNLSCTYVVTGGEGFENTANVILDDSAATTQDSLTFFVNTLPYVATPTFADDDGDTSSNINYKEYLDFVQVVANDTEDCAGGSPCVTPTVTIYDPDDVVKVNAASMTHSSGDTFRYDTNVLLDAVGDWNITVEATDANGDVNYESTTFTVSVVTKTITTNYFAYDQKNISTDAEISDLVDAYGFEVILHNISLENVSDSTWTSLLAAINNTYNKSYTLSAIRFSQPFYSDDATVKTAIENNLDDLIGGDYLTKILFLYLEVPPGTTPNAANSARVNNITKNIFQTTGNAFPHYLLNYNDTNIDTNYARANTFPMLTVSTVADYLNLEFSYMQNSSTKTRIYSGLSDTIKAKVKDFQENIFRNLRDNINNSVGSRWSGNTYGGATTAQLNNGDLIIAERDGAPVEFDVTCTPAHFQGYDVYDLFNEKVIKNDILDCDNLTVNLTAYQSTILYFENLSQVVVSSDDSINLYSDQLTPLGDTTTYRGAANGAFNLVTTGNRPDIRVMMTDPDYDFPDFYVNYAAPGYEGVNMTNYDLVILGAISDLPATSALVLATLAGGTDVYGYTAVSNYGTNNYPYGCTIGVDCTDWNRTYWIQTKQAESEQWTNISADVNVFIDGLDIGSVNDVDGLFEDSMKELTDYVRITKGRLAMLNTYTEYQSFATYGDSVMKESCVSRWDGSTTNPDYSYEDFSIELDRYNFYATHGIPVYCQAFGDITNHTKAAYTYMASKVLGYEYFSYNQPKFWNDDGDSDGDYDETDGYGWNYFKYPDVGVALEADLTDLGDGSYSRRYSKGTITINTTDHTYTFDNNIQITNMSLCMDLYDNDDGVDDEGYVHVIINGNLSRYVDFTDDDLTAFVKTTKCVDINESWYEESGFYELTAYYIDNDATYTGNSGLYVYYEDNSTFGQYSFYDDTENGKPPNEDDFKYYARGTNIVADLVIESTKLAPIDEITTGISRSQSGTKKIDVDFTSTSEFNVSIYDKPITVSSGVFNSLTTIAGDPINTNLTSDCTEDDPTYSTTIINGETWQACRTPIVGDSYSVRVVMPHLSDTGYRVDGNNPPVLTNQALDLINLQNGNQTYTLTYNVSDADDDVMTCHVIIWPGDVELNGTTNAENDWCNVTFTNYLNETLYYIEPEVKDSENVAGVGYNVTLATENLVKYFPTGTANTDDNQYMYRQYALNFTDLPAGDEDTTVTWSVGSGQDSVSFTVNNDTSVLVNDSETIDIITTSAYDYQRNTNDTYYVDWDSLVFFDLTLNNNLGVQVDAFDFNVSLTSWRTGATELYHVDSGEHAYGAAEADSVLVNVSNLAAGATDVFNVTHNQQIIYSNGSTTQSVENISGVYGLRYFSLFNDGYSVNYMYSSLYDNANTIIEELPYSGLPVWTSKLNYTAMVSDEVNGNYNNATSEFTITPDDSAEIVTYTFNPKAGGSVNYIQLNYTHGLTVCTDGVDNEGDGLIDNLDHGCHTDGDPNNAASYDPALTDETYCGDAYLDSGEQCDDGGASESCTATCEIIVDFAVGGGGGPSATEETEEAREETQPVSICGDGTCSDDETPWGCWSDCRLTAENFQRGEEAVWNKPWFPDALITIVAVSLLAVLLFTGARFKKR